MLLSSSPLLSSPGLRGCRRFQSSAVNYTTMFLKADSERLYVGARGAVFALNASDISASSALTVSLFVSVLLHVVRLKCHVFLFAMASFASHHAQTFEATNISLLGKVFIPLVCVCVALFLTPYITVTPEGLLGA